MTRTSEGGDRRLRRALWSAGTSLLSWAAGGAGLLALGSGGPTFSGTERSVALAMALSLTMLVLSLASLVLAVTALRRPASSWIGTLLALSSLVVALLGLLGSVAFFALAFFVLLISYGAVTH